MRKDTCCRHMRYSFRLAARVLLYAPSHRRDNTYHSLCYTSRGALAGTRNRSMGPPWRINPTTHRTMSERPYHGATSRSGTRNRSMGPPRRINPTTNRTSTHGKCFRLPGFTANDCKNGFLLVRLHFYQVSLVVHIDISENKNNIVKDMYLYNIKKIELIFLLLL